MPPKSQKPDTTQQKTAETELTPAEKAEKALNGLKESVTEVETKLIKKPLGEPALIKKPLDEPVYFTKLLANVLDDTSTKLHSLANGLPSFLEAHKTDTLRMAFFNIGGLTKNKVKTLEYLLEAELDVLFLIETRILNDASYAALRDAKEAKELESKASQLHSKYQEVDKRAKEAAKRAKEAVKRAKKAKELESMASQLHSKYQETDKRAKEARDLQSVAHQIHLKYQEFIYQARSNRSGGLMVLLKRETFKRKKADKDSDPSNFHSIRSQQKDAIKESTQVEAAESESDTDERVQQAPENSKSKGKPEHYHEVCDIKLSGTTYIFGYRNNFSGSVDDLIKDIVELRPKNEPFVILGDFNTTNVKWISKHKDKTEGKTEQDLEEEDFDFEFECKGKLPSWKFLEGIKQKVGCDQQYIKTATSGRSMRPLDLLFARKADNVIKEVFVAPFIDNARTRDHAPVFFLANKKVQSNSLSVTSTLDALSLEETKDSTIGKQNPDGAKNEPSVAPLPPNKEGKKEERRKGKK